MKFLNARPNSHQVPYNKTCRYNQTAKNLQRDQLASHSIEVRALAAQVYTCRVCLHFLPHPGTNSHANSNSDTGTSLHTERKQTSSTTIDTLLEARRETNLGLKPLGSFTCTIWRWCKSCANQRGISTTDPRATCIKNQWQKTSIHHQHTTAEKYWTPIPTDGNQKQRRRHCKSNIHRQQIRVESQSHQRATQTEATKQRIKHSPSTRVQRRPKTPITRDSNP